jgi:hypothetical protein
MISYISKLLFRSYRYSLVSGWGFLHYLYDGISDRYRIVIGNQTCVFEKENDPTLLRSPSAGSANWFSYGRRQTCLKKSSLCRNAIFELNKYGMLTWVFFTFCEVVFVAKSHNYT